MKYALKISLLFHALAEKSSFYSNKLEFKILSLFFWELPVKAVSDLRLIQSPVITSGVRQYKLA